MSKDKLKKLEVYAAQVKERLSAPVSDKHKAHPESLKQYLNRELEVTLKKIEGLRFSK